MEFISAIETVEAYSYAWEKQDLAPKAEQSEQEYLASTTEKLAKMVKEQEQKLNKICEDAEKEQENLSNSILGKFVQQTKVELKKIFPKIVAALPALSLLMFHVYKVPIEERAIYFNSMAALFCVISQSWKPMIDILKIAKKELQTLPVAPMVTHAVRVEALPSPAEEIALSDPVLAMLSVEEEEAAKQKNLSSSSGSSDSSFWSFVHSILARIRAFLSRLSTCFFG